MYVKLVSYTKGVNGEPPEKLIELSARVSYESFSKLDEHSHEKLIRFLIDHGHLSPLEFADATFEIDHVSRSLLAQITRHRLASFMVRSQRYVNENNFEYTIPTTIQTKPKAKQLYNYIMKESSKIYSELTRLGVKKEDARMVLPNSTYTHLYMKANFREWLHIIDLRVSLKAQWEIRDLLILIWKELYAIAPTVFHINSFKDSKDFEYKNKVFESIR